MNKYFALSVLVVSFSIAVSCSRVDAPPNPQEKPVEEIDFYGSKEIAEAHAAIPQYKSELLQGNFAAAWECAQKVNLKQAISTVQACSIYVLIPCNDCSDGKCRSCRGAGECVRCSADGACSTCKGERQRSVPCTSCLCQHCGGSGGCTACKGFGKKQCSTCSGTGYGKGVITEKCTKCDGKGQIEFQMTRGTRPCPTCRGGGKIFKGRDACSTCNGRARIICKECRGSGRCTQCGGGGRNPCSICSGSGQFIQTCPECKGSGKCPICTGTHVCPTCKGNKTCPTCAGRSAILKYTLIADRAWLKTNSIIYSSMLAPPPTLYAPKFMLNGRCIIMPPDLRNGIAIIEQPSNYANAARNLLIKE